MTTRYPPSNPNRATNAPCAICKAEAQTDCDSCCDSICLECVVTCGGCKIGQYCISCAIKRGFEEIGNESYCEDCALEFVPDEVVQ